MRLTRSIFVGHVPSGYVGVLWKRFGGGTVLDPRKNAPRRPRELTPEELELTPSEEALVARVMAQHPALTYEEAVYDLRMAGM
jgi:hypothetical protein